MVISWESLSPGSYIEPSQGTHFFQNLTSFGVGYFTLDTGDKDTIFAGDYLAEMPAEYESDNVRIVRFAQPLTVAINGRSGQGIVLKPEHNE